MLKWGKLLKAGDLIKKEIVSHCEKVVLFAVEEIPAAVVLVGTVPEGPDVHANNLIGFDLI